jgi:hypothetical protein
MRNAALRTYGQRQAADFEQAAIAGSDKAIAARGEFGLGFLTPRKEQ